MDFAKYFPIWDKLTAEQQERVLATVAERTVKKGTVVHDGSVCTGLLLVKSGQLRAYILSDEGREVTVYRLFDRDICLFSASCVLNSVQFEIIIEAEKEAEFWVIPPMVFKKLMDDTIAQVQTSGEAEKWFDKWFKNPIPPKNLNMNFELSDEMKALFKEPNDKALN